MKKILILFMICFSLTGCNTKVNLKIDEKKAYEKITIYDLKTNIYSNNILDEEVQSNLDAFEMEYEYYDIKEFENNGNIGKTYELSENLELWWELSHVRPCYEMFDFRKTNTHISLNTSDEYRCGYLYGANDVTVVVESDLTVESSNADKVDGNKLIWNINNDNYKNKSIKFSYKLLEDDEIINNENEQNNEKVDSTYVKIIFYALSIVFLISVLVIYQKIKNSNK